MLDVPDVVVLYCAVRIDRNGLDWTGVEMDMEFVWLKIHPPRSSCAVSVALRWLGWNGVEWNGKGIRRWTSATCVGLFLHLSLYSRLVLFT